MGKYDRVNPLMPTQQADWAAVRPPGVIESTVFSELRARTGTPQGTYVFPIRATAAMRMLTSPRLDDDFIFAKVCR